jgi:uncharacterized surface protein with fasciclin (FAS1) repeats
MFFRHHCSPLYGASVSDSGMNGFIIMNRLRLFPVLIFLLGWPVAHAGNLIDTAEKSSEIRIFVEAVKSAGLDAKLKENGPFTVFAPSNSAFSKLDGPTRDAIMKDKSKLAAMLSHHILAGKTLVTEVKPGKTKALDGNEVTLKSDNGKVTVDEANVTQSDIAADNGVIHIVDSIVLPQR